MKTFNLDWNCIIDLEEKERPNHAYVNSLLKLHRSKHINISLMAVSASETTKAQSFPESMKVFDDRIEALGLGSLSVTPVPAIINMTYIGQHSRIVADAHEFNKLRSKIWSITAQNIPEKWRDFKTKHQITHDNLWHRDYRKWRNIWCDTMCIYCHIESQKNYFVTNNTRDFQDHENELSKIGFTKAVTPKEAYNLCSL